MVILTCRPVTAKIMLKSMGSQRHPVARDRNKKKIRRAQLQRDESSHSLCINGRVTLSLDGSGCRQRLNSEDENLKLMCFRLSVSNTNIYV